MFDDKAIWSFIPNKIFLDESRFAIVEITPLKSSHSLFEKDFVQFELKLL